uniref:Centrosomal protein 85 n=1 Tax=Varanus komodoensis TaxID=61221 RepID=A0A8D2KU44_VARKO
MLRWGNLQLCSTFLAINESCSAVSWECTQEFYSMFLSKSSFQPIRTQVAIPTAHVMPSMLDRSSCSVGKSSIPQTTLASSLSVSSGDAGGPIPNHDPDPLRHSQVLHRSPLHLYQTSVENGCDQSVFLTSDQASVECAQRPVRLAAEFTFNQTALDRQSTGPWSQLQMCSSDTTATGQEKEPSKALLDTNPAAEASRVNEKQVPLGLSFASMCSSPTTAPSRMWKQEACALHPQENCALSAWKQHLDHVRLQLEQVQLQNKAACYHPFVNSTLLHSLDPAHWFSIMNANENLLREKEILIDRQRQHISQLEQKVRESELQVHNALFGHPAPYGDIYLLRMQELQRENVFLRAQFAEKTELLSKEKIELERKLSATEGGIKQAQEAQKETIQKHTVELKKQEERVKARDKHIEHLKKKCQKESEQNREKQQRIETLERYVADLPMLEDHRKQIQQLKEAQQTIAALQETVTVLKRELGDVRTNFREKELQLEMQKHKEMELLSTVHSMNVLILQAYSGVKEHLGNGNIQKCFDHSHFQIVDNQKKKIDQLSSQVKDLEEQVSQEEGTGQALKAEALRQESALQQLRVAVRELSAQNQELMEKNLTLEEQLRQRELDPPLSDVTTHLTQELHSELASCLQDLQSVCSVVTQRVQGKDPNLSLLLGIHKKEDLLKPDVLAKKLEDVKQLHKEIEDLRTAISDRYAQDMGDNCITQ